jgi:hypothetical protein
VISIYGMGGLGKSNFSQTCVPKTRAQWNVWEACLCHNQASFQSWWAPQ